MSDSAISGALTGLGNLYSPSGMSPEEKRQTQQTLNTAGGTLANVYKKNRKA